MNKATIEIESHEVWLLGRSLQAEADSLTQKAITFRDQSRLKESCVHSLLGWQLALKTAIKYERAARQKYERARNLRKLHEDLREANVISLGPDHPHPALVHALETDLRSERLRRADAEVRLNRLLNCRVERDLINGTNVRMTVTVNTGIRHDTPEDRDNIWNEALFQLRRGLEKELNK